MAVTRAEAIDEMGKPHLYAGNTEAGENMEEVRNAYRIHGMVSRLALVAACCRRLRLRGHRLVACVRLHENCGNTCLTAAEIAKRTVSSSIQ